MSALQGILALFCKKLSIVSLTIINPLYHMFAGEVQDSKVTFSLNTLKIKKYICMIWKSIN